MGRTMGIEEVIHQTSVVPLVLGVQVLKLRPQLKTNLNTHGAFSMWIQRDADKMLYTTPHSIWCIAQLVERSQNVDPSGVSQVRILPD